MLGNDSCSARLKAFLMGCLSPRRQLIAELCSSFSSRVLRCESKDSEHVRQQCVAKETGTPTQIEKAGNERIAFRILECRAPVAIGHFRYQEPKVLLQLAAVADRLAGRHTNELSICSDQPRVLPTRCY